MLVATTPLNVKFLFWKLHHGFTCLSYISFRMTTGWRVCIDYRKLNSMTRKDHFPLPFVDQILERLAGQSYYCFLDGYSGYNQVLVDPADQEKTTFTCPFGTFAYGGCLLVCAMHLRPFNGA